MTMSRILVLSLLLGLFVGGHAAERRQGHLRSTHKHKGWGNIVDSDGGADVEYGQQTVSERNDFSEKQYESDDPNDDENGYTGDYNTPETEKIDDEEEDHEDAGADDDDDGEESLVQTGSKTDRKKKGW